MLTDLQCNAKKTPRKLYDVDGVPGFYLYTHPNQSRYWRLRFKLADGVGRDLALGVLGKVTLKEARAAALDAREILKAGGDPRSPRKAAKLQRVATETNTFAVVAASWRDTMDNEWSPTHAATIEQRIAAHLLPPLGDMPVKTITAVDVLAAVKKISTAGKHQLAKRVGQYADSIMGHAVASGLLDDAPRSMRDAIKKPKAEKHHAALPESALPEFLRKLDGITDVQARSALKLALLTGVRSQALTGATWQEFDIEAKLWTVPPLPGRVKGTTGTPRQAHLVPLSRQACEVIAELRQGRVASSSASPIDLQRQFAFPSKSKRGFVSHTYLRWQLEALGYAGRQSPHGFRRLLSTLMVERGADPDVCDLQLSHLVGSAVSRVYNSAKRMPERTELMQQWADTLDELRNM